MSIATGTARTAALFFPLLILATSCKETPRVTPEITAAPSASATPSARATAAAAAPITEPSRALSASEERDLRRTDERTIAALRSNDRAALRTLAAKGVNVDATVNEISDAECVGDVIGFEAAGDHLVVRHVLGHKEYSKEGTCQGAHELRVEYVGSPSDARLTGAHRWGW